MKAFLCVLALSLFCSLSTAAVASDGFAPDNDLGDLGSCKEDGDTDQSIRACTAIIQAKKETTAILAKAYNYRGYAQWFKSLKADYDYQKRIYRGKADYKLAFADYDEAIRLNPKNVWFYTRRGDLHLDIKNFDLAIADLTQVIELRPDIGYKRRAEAYVRKKDFARAAIDFDQAMRLDPKDASIVKDRAEAYVTKGDLDGAIAAYDDVLKLDPGYAHAFQGRGHVYYQKGNYDRAIADYDQAIKLPGMIPTGLVFYYRAQAYAKKGDLKRAIGDYDQAIKIDPEFTAAIVARDATRKLLK